MHGIQRAKLPLAMAAVVSAETFAMGLGRSLIKEKARLPRLSDAQVPLLLLHLTEDPCFKTDLGKSVDMCQLEIRAPPGKEPSSYVGSFVVKCPARYGCPEGFGTLKALWQDSPSFGFAEAWGWFTQQPNMHTLILPST